VLVVSRQDPFRLLVQKLERHVPLASGELAALASLPHNLREYPAGTDILREGDRPSQSCFVVEGFLYRFKFVQQGNRQIMSFHIPGDIPDVQSLHLAHADHYLGTLSPALVMFIPHAALLELLSEQPRLASFFWRESLVDAAIFREWIVNIGRRSAFGRLAHLFCEQATRLKQIGLGDDTGFPHFFTQTNLADATGLSIVHVNRTVQNMRRRGLIGPFNKKLAITDWDGLVAAGDFNPDYLHLQ
jgi:CRP-like cAMP-binding protein